MLLSYLKRLIILPYLKCYLGLTWTIYKLLSSSLSFPVVSEKHNNLPSLTLNLRGLQGSLLSHDIAHIKDGRVF